MALRRQKSRKQRAADLAANYLNLKAGGKAAKAAKGTAVTVTKKAPSRRVKVLAGAGVAAVALVAVKLLRGGGDSGAQTA